MAGVFDQVEICISIMSGSHVRLLGNPFDTGEALKTRHGSFTCLEESSNSSSSGRYRVGAVPGDDLGGKESMSFEFCKMRCDAGMVVPRMLLVQVPPYCLACWRLP